MPALNIFPTCRMNPATGYGRLEIGLVKGLMKAGAEVALTDADSDPRHPITLITGSPEWGEYIPGRRWALTMSESTRVSSIWVDCLNTLYERVFVPAPCFVDIYKDSGVQIPVQYIPLGVDFSPPEWVERELNGHVNWLTYSLGDTRKGAELAMLAFNRQFQGDERHHMYIKCRDNPMWLSGLEDPQITIVRGQISEHEWNALLASCHAFIFASRGEGFGYPPREAVLAGLPTVATEAHGLWDVGEWGFPIPVKEMRAATFDFIDANEDNCLWWEPDARAIDAQMCAILADYPAALDKARAGREYLLRNFTWEQTACAIMSALA